ncbi:hypothetical protein ACE1TI_20775 [Alteribacillus sp. JSM 102045]|uniref:hypothetical protein n=1 Tax=Alteribacillus sp. JSM 102045 TaxID=1562101 RepID=UPI0035BF604F
MLDTVKEDAYRIALKLPRHMNKDHWNSLDHTLIDFAYIEGEKSTPQYFKSIFEDRYNQYAQVRKEKEREKQLPVYPNIDWLGVSKE